MKNRDHRFTLLLLIPVVLVLVAYVLYPSLRTLIESFQNKEGWSGGNYKDFFASESRSNLQALWNSVYISLLSVFFSALIGVPLAFIFNKYEFPGRSFFSSAAILPIVLPSLVGVMAFMFLYGESGLVPNAMKDLFGLENVPFKIGGVSGILIVHAYTMYVYFYMTVSSTIRSIDPSLEEAAYNLGASRMTVFRKVTLPLLTPAIVGASLLVFMTSMASFSAPFLLAGGFRVLSLQIYFSKVNGNLSMAATQSVILSIVSISFLLFMRWYQNRRDYRMATKGIGAHRSEIKNPLLKGLMVAVGIVGVIILLLPHMTILILSLVPDGTWTYQTYPSAFNGENYLFLFTEPKIWNPVRNSLILAFLATLGNLVFGVLTSYVLVKRKFVGKNMLDIMVMLPWALPATVVGMNLVLAFNESSIFTFGHILVGTFWILPLAYFIRHIPLVVRSTNATLEQLDDSLEEVARNLGAKWFYLFRRVVLPLVMPGVMAGTLLAFVEAVGEFPTSVLLYTLGNRPISIEIMNQLRMFNMGQAAAYGMIQISLIGLVLFISNKFFGIKAERSL
ncbi:iron(III) transport system permease protein [Fictibacillus enclensis]|uniref:Iron ABC transporter permease n=1 Tax=Fictibacillus enclensis TaxID=1017270 RepID=A0A0V8J4P1_9BACL|nr:iron ABC transporter permease [Fictibacillus enclensis]KSU81929.1 iron ABC transporter permease [Fictibacillus enclensis]SCC28036.1 iron(III) transport system permease protein [Fictibacillus enclensis]